MTGSIDTALFFLINRGTANPLFDVLMPLLSERGFLLALPVLVLAFIAAFRRQSGEVRRPAGFTLLVLIAPVVMFFFADGVNDLLKDLFARPRPCHVLEGVRLLVRCPQSFSLPSGHAIASFAFAVSFALISRTIVAAGWRWYVLVLAAAIAFSRVYIGVHYPSDVLLGSLLGIAMGWSAPLLVLRKGARSHGAREGQGETPE